MLLLAALRCWLLLVVAFGVLGVLGRGNRDDLGDGLQGFVRRWRQRSEGNRQLAFVTNPLVASRGGVGEKVENNSVGPDVDLGYPEFLSTYEVPGCRRAPSTGDMAKAWKAPDFVAGAACLGSGDSSILVGIHARVGGTGGGDHQHLVFVQDQDRASRHNIGLVVGGFGYLIFGFQLFLDSGCPLLLGGGRPWQR